MLNLMRADMYRILRGKGIYITFAIMIAVAVLTIFVFRSSMQTGVVVAPEDAEYFNPFLQQEVITGADAAVMALSSMDFHVFLFLPLFIFIAMSPFSSAAVKNELTIGISRVKFYLSKWILASALGVVMMLVFLALAILFGIIDSGVGDWGNGFVTNVLQSLGMQVLFALAMNSVGIFFCFVIRKAGATEGVYIAFALVPQMVFGLISIAYPEVIRVLEFDLPSQFGLFAQVANNSTGEIARGLAIGAAYLIIPAIAGIAIFKKAEIK